MMHPCNNQERVQSPIDQSSQCRESAKDADQSGSNCIGNDEGDGSDNCEGQKSSNQQSHWRYNQQLEGVRHPFI
ncbi:hypothetical protein D3C73_800310 [compost metagenome]